MAALHFVERQLRNNCASALCGPAVCLEKSIERDRDSLERGGTFSIWFAKRHSASDNGDQASDQSTFF
jgi:hypothetical protein